MAVDAQRIVVDAYRDSQCIHTLLTYYDQRSRENVLIHRFSDLTTWRDDEFRLPDEMLITIDGPIEAVFLAAWIRQWMEEACHR